MAATPPLAPIQHGTVRGFRQHKRRGTPVCEPCLEALREHNELKDAERLADPAKRFASPEQAAWYGGQFQHSPGAAPTSRRTPPGAGPPPLPAVGNPAWGVPIRGRDLVVGDVIVYLGRDHPVDRFEKYRGSLADELGAGTRTAYSGTWGMTVGPDAVIRIRPRKGSSKQPARTRAQDGGR